MISSKKNPIGIAALLVPALALAICPAFAAPATTQAPQVAASQPMQLDESEMSAVKGQTWFLLSSLKNDCAPKPPVCDPKPPVCDPKPPTCPPAPPACDPKPVCIPVIKLPKLFCW